jgi:peptide/nickel transport system permease protein
MEKEFLQTSLPESKNNEDAPSNQRSKDLNFLFSTVKLRRLNLKLDLAVMIALSILGTAVITALLADVIAPLERKELSFLTKLKPPFWMEKSDPRFPLGTDNAGHDIWRYLVHGARTSLIVGIVSPTISAFVGVTLGVIAGFKGKIIGTIIMRMVDIQLAFPFMVLALVLVSVLKPGMFSLILVLSIAGWAAFARVSRGEVLAIRAREYVLAAQAVGVPNFRIAWRHVLPNIFSSLIVFWTFFVGVIILAEATLSFLGLGLPAPAISWGGMLTDARNYLDSYWWVAFWPGLTITLVVMSINTVGDWLRDLLNPTTRN